MDDLRDAGEARIAVELGADRIFVAEQEEAEIVAPLEGQAAPAIITAGPESPPMASIAIRGALPTFKPSGCEAGLSYASVFRISRPL